MHDNSRSSMSSLISTRPERYWLMLGWRTPLIRDNSDDQHHPKSTALGLVDSTSLRPIPALISGHPTRRGVSHLSLTDIP